MSIHDPSESTSVTRLEAIASQESSFYTLSNRLILPFLYVSAITLFPVSRTPTIITLILIVLEIVIRYVFKTTLKNSLRSGWLKMFGTKRKLVKN